MNRRIIRLAIPNIIANITIPLLGLVDLAIVGHFGNAVYIGAIAVGTTILNFLYWNLAFLRMGTSGLTAQAYGRRDFDEAARLLGRSLAVAAVVALPLVALHVPIGKLALHIVGASDEVSAPALAYFSIVILGAPAVMFQYTFKGWFIGMQNARVPMAISIMTNVLNIVFSLTFVLVFDMGIRGVALGTLLAQYCDVAMALGVMRFSSYRKIWRRIRLRELWQFDQLLRFFRVNGNIFLRTACLVAVFTFFTAQSARESDLTLAVNTLLMQLFTLFSYFMDGFAYAGEALSGRYVGAGNYRQLRRAIVLLMRWGLGLALCVSAVYFLFGQQILALLTNVDEVLATATLYLPWVLAVPIAGFAAFLWDGIYIGASATALMRNCMFGAMALFFALFYALHDALGINALWLAFIAFLFARSLLQTVFAKQATRQALALDAPQS